LAPGNQRVLVYPRDFDPRTTRLFEGFNEGWRYEADTPYIDFESIKEEWRAAGKKEEHWLSPEGNIAISPDQQETYIPGLYYVDHFNGNVYQVGPGSTELIKIDLDEIKIN